MYETEMVGVSDVRGVSVLEAELDMLALELYEFCLLDENTGV